MADEILHWAQQISQNVPTEGPSARPAKRAPFRRGPFSGSDDRKLRAMAPAMTVKELAAKLNRSEGSIISRLEKLSLSARPENHNDRWRVGQNPRALAEGERMLADWKRDVRAILDGEKL